MMKKFLSILSLLFVVTMNFAQTNLTSSENYVYSKTCLNGDCSKASENVQYFDSWGKPIQQIDIKYTPAGKDLVGHIEYDQFGRQAKSYLPIPQAGTQNGAIYTSPLSNATAVYGSEKIYSEKIFENSPLGRVNQLVHTGNDWSNNPVHFNYDANSDGEVTKYTVTTTWFEGRTKYILSNSGSYSSNTLSKNAITNEDGNVSVEFKNKKGQTVLLRKKEGIQNVDTNYIYDEYGQLAYVIPPLASQSGSVDQATLNNLCYQYHYDGWKRLVEKKIPGKGWEYMVYDKQGRIVGVQDAVIRIKGQWLYTKYDHFGRVVFTGICTGGGRATEQANAEAYGNNNVNRTLSAFFNREGMDVYYDPNGTYPTAGWVKLLSVNYYDTYPVYGFNPPFPGTILGQTVVTDAQSASVNTQALPTLSLVKNIEDDNWTKSYVYYDSKRRPVGAYSINYLGGYTKTESELDFAGITKQTKVYHKRQGADTEKVISQTFEYDNQNRVKKLWHQVDSNPQELLSENSYNELSQLVNKKTGNNLQSVDYTYDLKGSMTKMNDPLNLGTDLFGYSVSYFDPTNTSNGKYTGSISEISWKTSQDNILRKYSYGYDKLSRMNQGIYSEPDTSVPQNGFFNEMVSYDLNGNISSLLRNGKSVSGTAQLIDNLTYSYIGNQLNTVTDTSGNYSGYTDHSGSVISYDDNGNMIDQIDKGVNHIAYNYLNLPSSVTFNEFINRNNEDIYVNTQYLYRADGVKLRKVYNYFLGKGRVPTPETTDYLDGFQYEKKNSTAPIILKFVPMAEGYFNFENNKYIYSYTDHLGNVRLSYSKNLNGSAEVLEENNYYPFGLKHEGYNALPGNPAYNYEYNGKELQKETGWSDYGARMYMSDIGRWGVIDPLAEKMRRHSPYNYAFNNPVNFIDPDGRAPGMNSGQLNWMDGSGHWNFDPNTTISGGDWFGGMNIDQNTIWQDGGGGSGGVFGTTYYGVDGYNYLQNLLNPGYDFSQFDFTQFMGPNPMELGKMAHSAMANYFKTTPGLRDNWFPEQNQLISKWDMKLRPDLHYMNSGLNSVWELKPISNFMDASLSLRGRYQAQGYADLLTMLKKEQFFVGSSQGAPIPPVNGKVLTDPRSGYQFSYNVPIGTDGMIYYKCLNCEERERQRQPVVDVKAVENAATAAAAAYLIYKIAVGIATWECGGCGVLVTP
jgi:RHS repeat-associated protein